MRHMTRGSPAVTIPTVLTLIRSRGRCCYDGKPTDATVLATARASPMLDATEGRWRSLHQPHQHRHCNFNIARRCLCAASIDERGRTMETARYFSWLSSSPTRSTTTRSKVDANNGIKSLL